VQTKSASLLFIVLYFSIILYVRRHFATISEQLTQENTVLVEALRRSESEREELRSRTQVRVS